MATPRVMAPHLRVLSQAIEAPLYSKTEVGPLLVCAFVGVVAGFLLGAYWYRGICDVIVAVLG